MFFGLDGQQTALADGVREYLEKTFDIAGVRALVEDPDHDGYNNELWSAACRQGWLQILTPERYGGLGLNLLDAAAVAYELGAGLTPGPWAGTLLAGEAIRLAGSLEQQERLLASIAAAETTAILGLRGPGGHDPSIPPFHADGGTLTGTASPVEYADGARLVVAAAGDAQGPGLYLVDTDAPGATVRPLDGYDRTTRHHSVQMIRTPGERLPGSDRDTLAELTDRAATLAAADLIGCADRALRRTLDYVGLRHQFGVPIGSFQSIKHDLADLHVAQTMAAHALHYAAHIMDDPDATRADRALAVSVAKSKAAETATAMVEVMIQFHGGIGFTWEHDAHLFYKRVKRIAPMYGDAAWHRERIAALTFDRPPSVQQ